MWAWWEQEPSVLCSWKGLSCSRSLARRCQFEARFQPLLCPSCPSRSCSQTHSFPLCGLNVPVVSCHLALVRALPSMWNILLCWPSSRSSQMPFLHPLCWDCHELLTSLPWQQTICVAGRGPHLTAMVWLCGLHSRRSFQGRALSNSSCRNSTSLFKVSGLLKIWLVREWGPKGLLSLAFSFKVLRHKTQKGRELA